jgi:cellulose biosynthesis protein BcsQ
MGKTITISSWKGGTGKTTLSIVLAILLAARKMRGLIIDLDSNCAISNCFGKAFQDYTSLEFLTEDAAPVMYPAKENIDIIPGNIKNMLLNNIMDRQLEIKIKKYDLKNRYDFIIIDPPGTWGAHSKNAVFAADTLIIPGTCSRIDFETTKLFFKTCQEYYIEADTFICVNCFNAESNLPGIYEEYQKTFNEFLIPAPVPYIKSLKKLSSDVNYPLQTNIKKRLDSFVNTISEGGQNA